MKYINVRLNDHETTLRFKATEYSVPDAGDERLTICGENEEIIAAFDPRDISSFWVESSEQQAR